MPELNELEADERWCDLVDRKSAGEDLSAEELAFLRQHEADSPARDAEVNLFAELDQVAKPEALTKQDRAIANAVLAEFRDESGGDVVAFPKRTVAIAGVAAIGLAAAAVAALWMRPAPDTSAPIVAGAPEIQQPAPAEVPEGFVLRSGALTVGDQSLASGDAIPVNAWATATADATCIDERLCAEHGARLKLIEGDAGDVELRNGRIRVDGHLGATQVVTFLGIVASDGGRFTAEVTPDDVIIVVLVGPVTVTRDGEVRELASGEQMHLGATQPVEPDIESDAAEVPAPVEHKASASDMLTHARDLRGAGHRRQAARAYEQLLKAHAKSPEAHAAAITLGNLELELNRPRAALRAFDRYLRKGGAMAEEAAYGRVRALERLGNEDKTASAAASFLKKYPQSVYASKVRALQ
jgi:hypothetical protein